ncbi:MAG: c-type cytochrome [Coriobacteriia bacterium]|nr:c-type cytochrome [Coriobacteriia bacterium]
MKMSPRLIIIGGLAVVMTVVAFVVFLPAVVFKPQPKIETQPLTALEQQGRDLYVSNGCMYCHSQFTRPGDVTPSRPSEAGQFAYDKPHQLGTLRTGPDLANIGLKRGDQWEIDHLKDPRSLMPDSIMPNFNYLSDQQLAAITAYLNTLGNDRNASTDLMIPTKYLTPAFSANKFDLSEENFAKGREIYSKKCLTCHGCSGSGDGPYSMINNARPENLRGPEFKNIPVNFLFWRVSEGVPGTVMPVWHQSLSEDDRWLAVLFIQKAFMDMTPAFNDEGDIPEKYKTATLPEPTVENIDAGKALFVGNCAFCHGYAGNGNGPDAAGLIPAPPSFDDTATYVDWTDGDYIWRVTDSIPMRAMPAWHTWFSAEQLALVSGYVKDMLIFPDPKNEPVDPEKPAAADAQYVMPADTDVMRGRTVYLQRCWMCHGDAGQGEGPDGTRLAPAPANFTDPALKELPDSDWYWRVSHGIGNAAMPQWQLLLSEEDRWAAIKYVKATFVKPSEPTDVSDEVPAAYMAVDPAPLAPTPDMMALGEERYNTLCANCHGAKALGDGVFGSVLMPTPANLTEDPAKTAGVDFWYWRIDAGVVGTDPGPGAATDPKSSAGTGATLMHPTAMPAWRNILTEQEKWAILFYAMNLTKAKDAPAPVPAGGGK